MAIAVGDWVRTCSPGIWQVVRQVPEHYEPRYTLNAPQQLSAEPLLVLKRLVSDKWKPALAIESAAESLVRPLTKSDAAKLQRFLQENAPLLAEFRDFAEPVVLLLNLSFSLPKKADFRPFQKHFEAAFAEPLQTGLTSDDILKVIAKSKYAENYNDTPRSATLQFVCQDLEVKRKHFIYRALHAHSF